MEVNHIPYLIQKILTKCFYIILELKMDEIVIAARKVYVVASIIYKTINCLKPIYYNRWSTEYRIVAVNIKWNGQMWKQTV